ncbi:hypothetical protein EMCRGX_G017216 [Ephydatia muelleri]
MIYISGGSPASAGLDTICQEKILSSLQSLQDQIAELRSSTVTSSTAATAPEPPKEKRIAKELSKAHSRMNACTTSTAITAEEKNEATKILTVNFMSSEETGQETAGSDNERVPPATIFKLRPLPWRSDRANSIIASMDRKAQRRSSDRAKEMCRKRYNGDPSTRQPPPSAPAWAFRTTRVTGGGYKGIPNGLKQSRPAQCRPIERHYAMSIKKRRVYYGQMKTFRCMANQGDDDDSIVKHKLATTAVRD